MADYPLHLVREHCLFDGRKVVIRPVRRNDAVLEQAFLSALSGESRYLRFHKWVNVPSDKLIDFLTNVDYDRHMALVCIASNAECEQLVGQADYVANPDGLGCDFDVVIADSWHDSGIAGLLMEALMQAARERGIQTMEGMVLTTNMKMLRFARGLGFKVEKTAEDPETEHIVKRL